MKLTDNECEILVAVMNDDHIKDYGWRNPEACTYAYGFAKRHGLNGKAFAAGVASLVKKGMLTADNYDGNDGVIALTDIGRAACEDIGGDANVTGSEYWRNVGLRKSLCDVVSKI